MTSLLLYSQFAAVFNNTTEDKAFSKGAVFLKDQENEM